MTRHLPHDQYMTDIADALNNIGIHPAKWWTSSQDGIELDAAFRDWPNGTVDHDTWPNGVYLAWNQNDGWLLIEDGGGWNTSVLGEASAGTYCDPRQVAADTASRLAGRGDCGPVCLTGRYDTAAVEAAVKAWEDDQPRV